MATVWAALTTELIVALAAGGAAVRWARQFSANGPARRPEQSTGAVEHAA
jgi:hypothetical protein